MVPWFLTVCVRLVKQDLDNRVGLVKPFCRLNSIEWGLARFKQGKPGSTRVRVKESSIGVCACACACVCVCVRVNNSNTQFTLLYINIDRLYRYIYILTIYLHIMHIILIRMS